MLVALAVAGICCSILTAGVWASYCLERLREDRDTREVCRIYLEQNAFVLQHFGRLRQEHFRASESCAYLDREHGGVTQGVYTYAITGLSAEGVVKLAWMREPGSNGSLLVPYLQVVERRSIIGLLPVVGTPAVPAPARSRGLIFSGPLRLRDAA